MPVLPRFFLAFCLFLSLVPGAHAHDYRTGDLVIKHAVIPSTVKSAPVAAGYLMISNSGTSPERLISVKTGFSGKSGIHQMKMIDGIMKMRPIVGGLEIAAGETVVLKKGSKHLMFMKLQEQMETGQLHSVILTFEHAGDVEIEMQVVDPVDLEGVQ